MTNEERSLIAYRISRAHEALEEARILFNAGHVNSYVNRLYYACFYATSALLLTKNLSTNRHGYLRSLLHKEFVKTGSIPQEMGKHFDRSPNTSWDEVEKSILNSSLHSAFGSSRDDDWVAASS